MLRSIVALTVALCAVDGKLGADDWPEFRGPTGMGIARGGLPMEWGPTRNVVWKQTIPGKGWSSPIVVAGRVYLTTSVPTAGRQDGDQSLRALCLDAQTGKTLWETEVFRQPGSTAPRIHSKNSHASPTPLCDGKRLYVHFGHLGTACLDLAGKVLWRNSEFKYAPVHGSGGSPILVDNSLVFSCDGADRQFVVALDRETGKVIWKTDRKSEAFKKFSFSTPLVIAVNGAKQIISPASDAVMAYDSASGREIWRARYDGYSVIPKPVYGHGLVFVCTGFDSPSLQAIQTGGEGDVTATHVAWSTRRAVPLTPSLLLVGDELYMVSDSGVASCLDAKTGKVHWQERLGGTFSASPLYADGEIYFQSEQGTGIILKAGREFQKLATNSLDERTLASYAAADGALFIRTEKHLYKFQAR